jgi:hypothetical protein
LLIVLCPIKISYIIPIQDMQVYVPACQVNRIFESDTPNLRIKVQALTIQFSDVINITSLSFVIMGLFWVREAPTEQSCTPIK